MECAKRSLFYTLCKDFTPKVPYWSYTVSYIIIIIIIFISSSSYVVVFILFLG